MAVTVFSIIFLFAGSLLFGLVFYQVGSAVYVSVRDLKTRLARNSLSIELLKNQVRKEAEIYQKRKVNNELGWNNFRKFTVKRLDKEVDGVTSVYLYPHDEKPLPQFKPGQYLTFNLKIPGQSKPVVRCYSLSDWYNPEYYRISVKKVPPPRDVPDAPSGLASTYFNELVHEGEIIDVKAPGGAFHLEIHDTFPVVLIGGGIGITPVYTMLKSIVEQDPDREVWFFYGARNGSEHVYKENLQAIQKHYANVNINVVYSRPENSDKEGEDYQYSGHLSVDLMRKVLPSGNFKFYICGPPPMMNTIVSGLEEWGIPKEQINFEAFGPATVRKANKAEGEKSTQANGEVVFTRSEKTVAWDGSDSLLEFAENNDITLPSGCRVGNCGTCSVAIRSGEVEYKQDPTFDIEKGSCLACLATPKGGKLEIDA